MFTKLVNYPIVCIAKHESNADVMKNRPQNETETFLYYWQPTAQIYRFDGNCRVV